MENRRPPYRRQGQGGYRKQEFRNKPRRNPLPEGFSLYYIAVMCPEDIDTKVSGFKEYMADQYGCKAAAKSPAHITVVPPFRAEDELEKQLIDFVHTFNMGMVPVDVRLKGYNQFGERVLYVDVEGSEALSQLEREAMQDFVSSFPSIIFGMKPDFNPHVTIATRDIPEGKLSEARAYFESNHPFEASFEAKELTLQKLENGWWKSVS